MDKELVAIQLRLRELGHDPGTIDGVWGKDTRAAIAAHLGLTTKQLAAAKPAVTELPWFDMARTQLGTKEAPGDANNPTVAGYFEAAVGHEYADTIAWCAAFCGAMLTRTGYKGTGSLMARSYLQWGRTLDKPQRGAVVVFKRGNPPAGHVGFVDDFTASTIKCLGGNQSNAVTVQSFPRSAVLGFRWPTEAVA